MRYKTINLFKLSHMFATKATLPKTMGILAFLSETGTLPGVSMDLGSVETWRPRKPTTWLVTGDR